MDNDKMMLALFAAHALPALITQRGAHDTAAITVAAFNIADKMMGEIKRREIESKRDQFGRIVDR